MPDDIHPLAAAILGADDRPLVPVPTPEWGVDIFMRAMSADESDAHTARESMLKEEAANDTDWYCGWRARMVAAHACDATGARIFTADQASALGAKNAAVIERLAEKAAELSAQSRERVDELGKASGGDPGDGSS